MRLPDCRMAVPVLLALLFLLFGCLGNPAVSSASFSALFEKASSMGGSSYCSADLKKLLSDDPDIRPLLDTTEFKSFAGDWLDGPYVVHLGCGGGQPKADTILTGGIRPRARANNGISG